MAILVVASSQTYNQTILFNFKEIIDVLSIVRDPSFPIFFCTIDIQTCDENLREFCIERDGKTCSLRTRILETSHEHKFCEFDDVLITRLFKHAYDELKIFTVVKSMDSGVTKSDSDVKDVSTQLALLGRSVRVELYKY